MDEIVFFKDALKDFINFLISEKLPTILIVPGNTVDLSLTRKSFALTRLELLSMDQNAWILAERNEKCQVVETRTELEWIIRNNKVGIWSPSRLILSSTKDLDIRSTSVTDLALWLVEQLDIKEIFSFGSTIGEMGVTLNLADVLRFKNLCMKSK